MLLQPSSISQVRVLAEAPSQLCYCQDLFVAFLVFICVSYLQPNRVRWKAGTEALKGSQNKSQSQEGMNSSLLF